MRPDWENLTQSVTQLSSPYNGAAHGRLAEIHIGSLLNFQVKSDLFKDVCRTVSLDQTKTQNYIFSERGGQLYARNRHRKDVAEYDNIIVVNGLPTVVEVKATNSSKKGRNPMNRLLNSDWRQQFFRPLQEAFNTNRFGFVVVTVPERISLDSPTQRTFKENGGKIIAMNASLQELKERAGMIITLSHKPRIVYSVGN